ncbi:MAG: cupin domain-containing protein [Candidatus Latescibacteria bacterium]|nr:cupin domain-containing protein [Candidatus Latescibacterota bacterium]
MKALACDNFYTWSIFSQERQIDFNGHLWVRNEGNILIDPVPMEAADLDQFDALGGASWIVLTNRDHEREADFFRRRTGAQITAHRADIALFSAAVDRPLEDGEEIVPGLQAIQLEYGKSPGEIALYWPALRLVLAGDLLVGAPLGRISLLPDAKLANPPRAALGLRKLLALDFDAVLMGDGHSILHDARRLLLDCLEERTDIYINKINIDQIPWTPWGGPEGFRWDTKDIDPLIGGRHLGYRLIRLPGGQATFPQHFHYFEEELFYILEGNCTLLGPRGSVTVEKGDFIACPPGPQSAHKFANNGDQPCVLLALSNVLPHDLAQYPDSDKILARPLLGKGGIYRRGDSVDYWQDEIDDKTRQ